MRYAYVFLSANNNGRIETTNRDSSGDEGAAVATNATLVVVAVRIVGLVGSRR